MSGRYFALEEAHRLALREEAQQRVLDLSERLDIIISGITEREYREYLEDKVEGQILDARIEAEQMDEVIHLSRRIRGEE